ncbi:MAG: hypothetical protein B7Z55_09735 [Planctomycetales bacterium 12-60-4]|nr:MAG: hypothetical protein B7Z55_09735 [Planctomycetales bacterium 12-60-4]
MHRNCVITRPSLLAIDVGNSRIKYGWFAEEPLENGRAWPACRQFTAGTLACPAPWDRIRSWTDPLKCDVAIAGSNPAVVEQIATHWRATTGRVPWVAKDRHTLPIRVEVEAPERVGLDRLLNAVAANVLRPENHGAIVVDSGTATTLDVVTNSGSFVGGAILPGFALSSKALHHYTALLPELSLAELGPVLPHALGTETRAALRSGIYWGQVGAIRQLVQQLCDELNWRPPFNDSGAVRADSNCWLVLTGGGGPWLAQQFPGVLQIPSFAMHGLVLTAWSHGIGNEA